MVARQLAVIKWRGKPVFVKHRSATEIAVRRASAFRNLAVRTVLCAYCELQSKDGKLEQVSPAPHHSMPPLLMHWCIDHHSSLAALNA